MKEQSKGSTGGSWVKGHLQKVSLADIFSMRVLGFACTLAWVYVVLFSPTIHFSTRNDISHFNSVFGFVSLGTLLVLLGGAFFASAFSFLMRSRLIKATPALLMSVAAFVLVFVEAKYFTQPQCSIASFFAGVGLGAFFLAWGEVYRGLPSLRAILNTVSSFLLAAVFFALIVELPHPFNIVVVILLPLFTGYIVFASLKVWNAPSRLAPVEVRRGAFFGRALLSLGFISFTEAVMRAFFLDALPLISDGSYPWFFLIATLVSGTIICATMLSREALAYGSAYKSIVFALGFIYLLLPILELGTSLADVLALVTYSSVMLLIWITLSKITRHYQLSALFVFGIGWGAQVAGMLAGAFGGAFLASFFEVDVQMRSLLALVCVCLLFFSYMFVFDERSIIRLAGGQSEDTPKLRPFRLRCEEVATQYSLTKRETEIMILMAKGRSNPRIQEEFDLTPGTVNAHMSHIYKKLDVHDKQEFLDVLEGRFEKGEEAPGKRGLSKGSEQDG